MKLTDQEWKTLRFGDTEEAKELFEDICNRVKDSAVEAALLVLPGVFKEQGFVRSQSRASCRTIQDASSGSRGRYRRAFKTGSKIC